ncbi:glycosyltransferase family 2 protein [Elizabethkingia miricola]|uniref:glycosyltransferase family 2 protein n=1 Tax=Elizabethkingia miricola TaxID=172045 RepID=UPI00389137A6
MKLSVITINYNNTEGLLKTIQSVVTQQESKDFEYIIIDGGSNDGSKSVILQYENDISYWVSEKDNGIYDAMNKGILAAKGDYILFINSGDELYDNTTISKLLNKIDVGGDIIYSDLEIIDDKIPVIGHYPKILKFSYFIENTLAHPGCLIRRQLFDTIGFYDTKLKICSDWKWFLLAIFKYNVKAVHSGITAAKFYLDGISSDENNKEIIKRERSITLDQEFSYFMNDYSEFTKYRDVVMNMKRSRLIKLLQKLKLINYLDDGK